MAFAGRQCCPPRFFELLEDPRCQNWLVEHSRAITDSTQTAGSHGSAVRITSLKEHAAHFYEGCSAIRKISTLRRFDDAFSVEARSC
jgi:hypothetical protein